MTQHDTPTIPGAGIAAPGYRLPAETRLGPVTLQVSDLPRSIEYYEQVLGLRTLKRDDNVASLGDVEAQSTIVVLVERRGVLPAPRRGRLGLFHVAYLLPTRADLAGFAVHLARESIPAGMSDHLVSEAFYLTDPDGLGIEVYADRPRSAWRTNGAEIAMDTKPLDLDDLTRDSKATRWVGAPPGTVVGHVHLHVGALSVAANFYHEGLGFDKMVWSYPGALFLAAGGYHHHLGLNTWVRDAVPAREDEARLMEWTILLPAGRDVAAAADALVTKGHPVELDGTEFTVEDPWGTQVRIRSES